MSCGSTTSATSPRCATAVSSAGQRLRPDRQPSSAARPGRVRCVRRGLRGRAGAALPALGRRSGSCLRLRLRRRRYSFQRAGQGRRVVSRRRPSQRQPRGGGRRRPGRQRAIGLVYWAVSSRPCAPACRRAASRPSCPSRRRSASTRTAPRSARAPRAEVSVAYRASAPGKTILRTWNRTGDPSDPAQWSPPAATTGASPRMSSGPRGPYLLTTGATPGDSRQKLLLRRLAGDGNVGRPIVLAKSPFGPSGRDLGAGLG